MVGNSLRSDIAPVVELGGWGVYMPYHSTWSYETDTDFAMNERVIEVKGAEVATVATPPVIEPDVTGTGTAGM